MILNQVFGWRPFSLERKTAVLTLSYNRVKELMAKKNSVIHLPKRDLAGADQETEMLERDLLKMVSALRAERTALDNAIHALERVKRRTSTGVFRKSPASI